MKLTLLILACLAFSGCASTVGLLTKDTKARPWFGVKADWYVLTHAAELGEKTWLLPVVPVRRRPLTCPLAQSVIWCSGRICRKACSLQDCKFNTKPPL